jgi:U3 small nucleolar RNA-associated protein MPP10
MTREEKIRRRRREKERIKKANQMQGSSTANSSGMQKTPGGDLKNIRPGKKSKDAEKEDILTQLRKGNVKVIGKKGELQDLAGKKRRKNTAGRDTDVAVNGGAGNLML